MIFFMILIFNDLFVKIELLFWLPAPFIRPNNEKIEQASLRTGYCSTYFCQ